MKCRHNDVTQKKTLKTREIKYESISREISFFFCRRLLLDEEILPPPQSFLTENSSHMMMMMIHQYEFSNFVKTNFLAKLLQLQM